MYHIYTLILQCSFHSNWRYMHFLENSMFVLNVYFCRELRFVAILRSKLRFLFRNTGVDSDFTQNFLGNNWRLEALASTHEKLNPFTWTSPKTCRGRCKNMVGPATKETYIWVPRPVASEERWKAAIWILLFSLFF